MIDTVGVIDVDDETRRPRELDRENLHAGQIVLDARSDLFLQLLLFLVVRRRHQSCPVDRLEKNGPAGPISPTIGENGDRV